MAKRKRKRRTKWYLLHRREGKGDSATFVHIYEPLQKDALEARLRDGRMEACRMVATLLMPDGEMELLFSFEDFQNIVRDRLGLDAEKVVEDLIHKAGQAARDLDSDLTLYEMTLEENRDAFQEVANLVKEASAEINKSRTNKKKVAKLLDDMTSRIVEHT